MSQRFTRRSLLKHATAATTSIALWAGVSPAFADQPLRVLADRIGLRFGTEVHHIEAGGAIVRQQLPLHYNTVWLEFWMRTPAGGGVHERRGIYDFRWPDREGRRSSSRRELTGSGCGTSRGRRAHGGPGRSLHGYRGR